MSYMMECSDLNAPAKAKNFSKPSMREVQPQRAKTVVYQQSQKARQWAGHEENNLSELFTLPSKDGKLMGLTIKQWGLFYEGS